MERARARAEPQADVSVDSTRTGGPEPGPSETSADALPVSFGAVAVHGGSGESLPGFAVPWLRAKTGASSLSSVRVHTDSAAHALATSHAARAVTIGQDIYFAGNGFRPRTPEGLVSLLHETAHTVQQRGTAPMDAARSAAQEAEVDSLLRIGRAGIWTTSAPGVLREPTYPRRTTGTTLLREASRVIALSRDTSSSDPVTRMWSNVAANFGPVTAGSIARRIWTHVFVRHFAEPDSRPGIESAHPRYFYSRTYGWVDGQHFFGFIDFAEQHSRAEDTREEAFEAATEQGFDIERNQQRVRDYVMLQRPPAYDPTIRLMQVRPPNTPLFRAPVATAGAVTRLGAVVRGSIMTGPEGQLFRMLDRAQTDRFLDYSARSAWTFEDPTSNQLGIRFFFQHGEAINRLPVSDREAAFARALGTFFGSIGVVDDQAELDRLAENLPGRERYEAPHTTEDRERRAHPELYRLP